MLYDKNGWLVEVDVSRTRKTYEQLAALGRFGTQCECNYCKNLNTHIVPGMNTPSHFPKHLIKLCASFGVDYRIPGEFYSLGDVENNTLSYHGFYSVYGSIKAEGKSDLGEIFFEDAPQFARSGFPDRKGTIMLGVGVKLPVLKMYQF